MFSCIISTIYAHHLNLLYIFRKIIFSLTKRHYSNMLHIYFSNQLNFFWKRNILISIRGATKWFCWKEKKRSHSMRSKFKKKCQSIQPKYSLYCADSSNDDLMNKKLHRNFKKSLETKLNTLWNLTFKIIFLCFCEIDPKMLILLFYKWVKYKTLNNKTNTQRNRTDA